MEYFAFQWHITEACDQRCKHCYIYALGSHAKFQAMALEDMVQVIENCQAFCRRAGRLPYFYLTGGDPILHPQFWQLAGLLKARGLPFAILGNPFHLTDDVCQKLRDHGCRKYQLSLDGLRETHDRIRRPGSWRITKACLQNLWKVGAPLAAERAALSSAQVLLVRIVSGLGTTAIAANSLGVSAESLCYMAGYGVQDASLAMVGQAVGAHRRDMAKRIAWLCTGMGMAIMALTGVGLYVFAPALMGIFTADAAVIALGAQVLRIEAFAEPMFGASIVASGSMQGAGDSTGCFILNLFSMWGVRLTLAVLLAPRFGLVGVWVAMCAELCTRGALFLLRMARGKYLQFVDADDTLEPFATELLVQRAEDNNADLVIAAYNRIVPYKPKKEAKLDPLLPNKKKQLTEQLAKFQTFGFLPMGFMTKEEFACGLMQEPASFYYGVMWNKLYRADLVRAHTDVRCSEEMTWSEDLYFNLTYIRYAERFFALTTPIYNYYDNPGSAVHLTKVRTAITARTALFSYYKELYEQLGLYEENKLQIFKYLISSSEA